MLALFLFTIYFVFLCLILSEFKQGKWWVEIATTQPNCLYYFGPFDSEEEAKANESGYLQDLQDEGAQEIQVIICQGQPQKLTVFED
jgi:hypothetical protein